MKTVEEFFGYFCISLAVGGCGFTTPESISSAVLKKRHFYLPTQQHSQVAF